MARRKSYDHGVDLLGRGMGDGGGDGAATGLVVEMGWCDPMLQPWGGRERRQQPLARRHKQTDSKHGSWGGRRAHVARPWGRPASTDEEERNRMRTSGCAELCPPPPPFSLDERRIVRFKSDVSCSSAATGTYHSPKRKGKQKGQSRNRTFRFSPSPFSSSALLCDILKKYTWKLKDFHFMKSVRIIKKFFIFF